MDVRKLTAVLLMIAGALGLAAFAINYSKGRTEVFEAVLGAAFLLAGIYYLRRGA